MPRQTFKLSIGATALEIKSFTTYQPSLVSEGAPTYSLSGASVDGGVQYEPKLLWQIGSILEYDDGLLLQAIFARSDQLRRSLSPYSLLIEDTITPVVEPGTVNTRKIVPTFTTTPVGSGFISYFAQYYGGFVAPPKLELYPTNLWQADFSIAEFDRVPP